MFRRRQDANVDQIRRVIDEIHIFGDPIEGLEIPQTALALLDVRLEDISRVAKPDMALVALFQFRGDEFKGGIGDNFGLGTAFTWSAIAALLSVPVALWLPNPPGAVLDS